jgi:hypothetical protein
MQQHGDMARRDAELASSLVTGELLEHTQRDDVSMRVAELGHTARELSDVERLRELLVDWHGGRAWLDVVDVIVRPREMMPAPQISRRIANDHGKHAGCRLGLLAQHIDIGAAEQRVKRILHDVEGIRGAHAFAAGERGEPTGMVPGQARDPVTTAALHGHRGAGTADHYSVAPGQLAARGMFAPSLGMPGWGPALSGQ